MTLRTLVTFHTSITEDRIETPDGMDFIQWPGRVIAKTMAELLSALGWKSDNPFDLQERGWEMYADCENGDVYLRIQWLEEVIVTIVDRAPDYTWYFKRKPPGSVFTRLMVGLDAALKADSRFSDIQWFTLEGYRADECGAAGPVDLDEGK